MTGFFILNTLLAAYLSGTPLGTWQVPEELTKGDEAIETTDPNWAREEVQDVRNPVLAPGDC